MDTKHSLSQLRFQAIKDFIGLHLHDAELSPDHLVQALGISRSYLYKLFVQYDFSFQEHIRTRRLAQIAAELRKPCMNKSSITDIALHYGFNNASHFSRCFTQQYGESPRNYRARMLKTGS
jgi:AraC-like DNA-binding protein